MIRFYMVLIGIVGLAVSTSVGAAATFGQTPESPRVNKAASTRSQLPDPYPYVAADILEYCHPRKGIWVDLGSGSGGVGLALAATDDPAASASTIVLVDPNTEALSKGLQSAQTKGLAHRVVAVVGKAESMPLPDGSVDLVVSRGSIFFWNDQGKGVQEVYRVLRPGVAHRSVHQAIVLSRSE